MLQTRLVFGLILILGLAACEGSGPDAFRNLTLAGETREAASVRLGTVPPDMQIVIPDYRVTAINVTVPKTLRVSEANMYYPIADIVWRGDPRGDRHAQVKAIFDTAFAAGITSFTSGRAVTVDVEVTRFHCLTEKARYTVGGIHSIEFLLTVRDAGTGAVLDGPRLVAAEIKAAGGAMAVEEDAQGNTQKKVITGYLTQLIQRELTQPVAVPKSSDPAPAARNAFDPVALAH